MDRRSVFVYGTAPDETTWETTISAHPWTPADETVGGMRVSAAGVPASYIVRRDYLLVLTLRVRESEWADLLNLVAFGQSAEPFLWYPDADSPGEAYSVYLAEPAPGTRWGPTRLAEYPQVFEVELTLRDAGSPVPWRVYFGAT